MTASGYQPSAAELAAVAGWLADAGVSVRGRVMAREDEIPEEELEDHVVDWPGKFPDKAKKRR